MCSVTRSSTRRSTRRVRPGDRLTESAKEFFSNTTARASTSASPKSSGGGLRKSSFRFPADASFQELQRKICPVTGIFREISADYQINATVLGKGHYGCVRECMHRETRRILAVKSIEKSKIRRIDHLRREVYLLHKMNHISIMEMIDCYEDASHVHIVTERYTGGELFDKISEATRPEGCFSERKVATIIKSLLEAVAYLHDNDIVHRDIKPENILFESPKEDAPIRLIDFGLSRKHKKGEEPMNNPVGTAYYMAPELLGGSYDRSCDMWSVGTIVYILLCGYPPFNGDTDPDIFKSIKKGKFSFPSMAWSSKSGEAKDFIKFLLRMDPSERPTAKEALGHAWLKNHTCGAKPNDGKQHEDLAKRIQSLKTAISKFKKSAVMAPRIHS